MEPPLPQLLGSPPVPRPMKRARFAFALSVGAWLAFMMFWVAIIVFVRGEEKNVVGSTVPFFGWKINGDSLAFTSFTATGCLSAPAAILGFTQRKSRIGKIAGILASVPLALWILFTVAAVMLYGGKK